MYIPPKVRTYRSIYTTTLFLFAAVCYTNVLAGATDDCMLHACAINSTATTVTAQHDVA